MPLFHRLKCKTRRRVNVAPPGTKPFLICKKNPDEFRGMRP